MSDNTISNRMGDSTLSNTNLFKPIKVGNIQLENRLVLAPTTRLRATENCNPTNSMLQFYVQRAAHNGGLLVTEAAGISPQYGFLTHWPVFYTDQQVAGWTQIVEAVHQQGSYISLQLLALGRQADPALFKKKGFPYLAPSVVYYDEAHKKKAEEGGNPMREMSKETMAAIREGFVVAAKRAVEEAKFDFVEIHAAHMCLLNQFIAEVTNRRTDEYGGSIENRARYVLEVVDAVVAAVGAEHVGIRFSPYSRILGGESIDAPVNPAASYGYILSELEQRAQKGHRLAYVSFVEPRNSAGVPSAEPRDIDTSWVNEVWRGVVIRAGNLLHQEEFKDLKKYVEGDDRTLIGCGRYFVSNPDLPDRLRNGHALTPYDRTKFYGPYLDDGYITWPAYGEENTYDATVVPVAL